MSTLMAGQKIDVKHQLAAIAIVTVDGEVVSRCFEARAGRKGYAKIYLNPLVADKRLKSARSMVIRGSVEVIFP